MTKFYLTISLVLLSFHFSLAQGNDLSVTFIHYNSVPFMRIPLEGNETHRWQCAFSITNHGSTDIAPGTRVYTSLVIQSDKTKILANPRLTTDGSKYDDQLVLTEGLASSATYNSDPDFYLDFKGFETWWQYFDPGLAEWDYITLRLIVWGTQPPSAAQMQSFLPKDDGNLENNYSSTVIYDPNALYNLTDLSIRFDHYSGNSVVKIEGDRFESPSTLTNNGPDIIPGGTRVYLSLLLNSDLGTGYTKPDLNPGQYGFVVIPDEGLAPGNSIAPTSGYITLAGWLPLQTFYATWLGNPALTGSRYLGFTLVVWGLTEPTSEQLADKAPADDGNSHNNKTITLLYDPENLYIPPTSTTYFVSPSGNITNNGKSWTTASDDLQDVINKANEGDQIWVAAGTYRPNRPADNVTTIDNANKNNAFLLKSGVRIYGGFTGTETALEQRSIQSNRTILSGDLNGDDENSFVNRSDNGYHIVVVAGAVADSTVLDGFTLSGANYQGGDGSGSIAINGTTVSREYGGALVVRASAPILSNLIITDNKANFGAGLYVHGDDTHDIYSSPMIINTTFHNNEGQYGAAVTNYRSRPTYINMLAYNNRVTLDGGAVYNWSSRVSFINATVAKNNAEGQGGGMFHLGSDNNITTYNSILFGNTDGQTTPNPIWTKQVFVNGNTVSLANNLIQDWPGGSNGNLNGTIYTANQVFADFANDDFTLGAQSPAIDAGNNSYYPDGVPGDIKLFERIANSVIDLGPFESSSIALPFRLIAFGGACVDGTVELQWATAQEMNGSHFVIERSADGIIFEAISTVNAKGNSTNKEEYRFIDASGLNGTSFYRLRMTDLDGTFEYSPTLSVKSCYVEKASFSVYPNPVHSLATVLYNSNITTNGAIQIIDVTGRVIKHITVRINKGTNTYSINTSVLNPGIYIVKLQLEGGAVIVQRLLRQ